MPTSTKPLPTFALWLIVLACSMPAAWVATPNVDSIAVAGCFFTMVLSWMYLRIYGRWAVPMVATLLFAASCFETAHLEVFNTFWFLSFAASALIKLVGVALMLFVGPRAKSAYARSVLFSLALEAFVVVYVTTFQLPLAFRGLNFEQVCVWAESFVMFGGLALDMTALILETRAARFAPPPAAVPANVVPLKSAQR